MTHEWIRWLLVSVVVGAVALPAGNVIAGDWMSPWPAYQLQDASGTPGYHRMHMTWSPFSNNYTTLYNTKRYVNIPTNGNVYRCIYIAFDAPYFSNSLVYSEQGNGWTAHYYNTPMWVTATLE